MGKRIKKADVIDAMKEGIQLIGVLALKAYGESLNQAGEQAFVEAIELGIENTIASLYDANVSDKEIIRVVIEHWGVSYQDAEDRLVYEKQQATIRSLKQHLKLQGYSSIDIEAFMRESKASIRIRHEKDLWKLKDVPEKLFKALQSNN
jgi:tRNA A37 threonylcarbamoyladenosine modification protein TsaB